MMHNEVKRAARGVPLPGSSAAASAVGPVVTLNRISDTGNAHAERAEAEAVAPTVEPAQSSGEVYSADADDDVPARCRVGTLPGITGATAAWWARSVQDVTGEPPSPTTEPPAAVLRMPASSAADAAAGDRGPDVMCNRVSDAGNGHAEGAEAAAPTVEPAPMSTDVCIADDDDAVPAPRRACSLPDIMGATAPCWARPLEDVTGELLSPTTEPSAAVPAPASSTADAMAGARGLDVAHDHVSNAGSGLVPWWMRLPPRPAMEPAQRVADDGDDVLATCRVCSWEDVGGEPAETTQADCSIADSDGPTTPTNLPRVATPELWTNDEPFPQQLASPQDHTSEPGHPDLDGLSVPDWFLIWPWPSWYYSLSPWLFWPHDYTFHDYTFHEYAFHDYSDGAVSTYADSDSPRSAASSTESWRSYSGDSDSGDAAVSVVSTARSAGPRGHAAPPSLALHPSAAEPWSVHGDHRSSGDAEGIVSARRDVSRSGTAPLPRLELQRSVTEPWSMYSDYRGTPIYSPPRSVEARRL